MINKQFLSNLPIKRQLQMLGSREERIDVWMEMELENKKAGRDACSPHEDEAMIECVANVLGDRIYSLEKRLDAIDRQATDARRR